MREAAPARVRVAASPEVIVTVWLAGSKPSCIASTLIVLDPTSKRHTRREASAQHLSFLAIDEYRAALRYVARNGDLTALGCGRLGPRDLKRHLLSGLARKSFDVRG